MMVIPSSDHTRQCGNLYLQRNQRRAKRLYKLKWLKFVQTPFSKFRRETNVFN